MADFTMKHMLWLHLQLHTDHLATPEETRNASTTSARRGPRLSLATSRLRLTQKLPDGRLGIHSRCHYSATSSSMAGTTLPRIWSNELISDRFLYREVTTAAPALLPLLREQPRPVGLQPSQLNVMAAEC